MTEHEALTRRDDEHLMGDESDESAPAADPRPPGLVRHPDELPRDHRGRVLGIWHVYACGNTAALDLRLDGWTALEGHLVDRALALGCVVAPGAYEGPRIED